MRRTTPRRPRPPLLALALALWAAQAWLAPPRASADIILAELPASAAPVHFADQARAPSVVGIEPSSGAAVTVSTADPHQLVGVAADDAARRYLPNGPEGFLTLTADRPIYGIVFAFGNPLSGSDSIAADGLDFRVGTLHGTPGGRVSILATGESAFRVVTVDSGWLGGIFDLRILARPVAVPEPAGWLAMGTGGVGLVGAWGWRRLRRRPRTAGSRR